MLTIIENPPIKLFHYNPPLAYLKNFSSMFKYHSAKMLGDSKVLIIAEYEIILH